MSPFDFELVPSIPRESIAIVHIKTAQNHVITPRECGEMISRRSHFFPSSAAAGSEPSERVTSVSTAPEGAVSARVAPYELTRSCGGGGGDI